MRLQAFSLSDSFDRQSFGSSKPEHLKFSEKPGKEPYDLAMSLRVPDHEDYPNDDGKKAKHRRDYSNADRPFQDDDLIKKCANIIEQRNRLYPEDKRTGIYIPDAHKRVMVLFGGYDSTVNAARIVRSIFAAYSRNELYKINPHKLFEENSSVSNVVDLHQPKDRYLYFPADYNVTALSGTNLASYKRLKTFILATFDGVTSIEPNGLYRHGISISGPNRFEVDAATELARRGINQIAQGDLITAKWLGKNLSYAIASTEDREEIPDYSGIIGTETNSHDEIDDDTWDHKFSAPAP